MIYKKYQHIEKLGSSEVDGILNGTCYLSYKIDGTNSCVWLKDDGTLGFGSRKRELNNLNGIDNAAFMETVTTNDTYKEALLELKDLLTKHPNWVIYGEWLIPVNLKTYKADAWKHFYIFDIVYYDDDLTQEELADDNISRRHENYICFDSYSKLLDTEYKNLKYIPLIAKLENPTEADIKELLNKTGDFLIDNGLGEGIVIKNYDYKNKYGRRTWAKMLTEDFINKKKSGRAQKKECEAKGESIEYEIIKLLTPAHIGKEKVKLLDSKESHTWEMKDLPELLNRVFDEFFRDNWEIILKKFHNPTINFKVLKQLSNDKVKEAIGL